MTRQIVVCYQMIAPNQSTIQLNLVNFRKFINKAKTRATGVQKDRAVWFRVVFLFEVVFIFGLVLNFEVVG